MVETLARSGPPANEQRRRRYSILYLVAETSRQRDVERRVDETEMQRRAQLAEEAILTDERLRGGLTDDQFDQILRWALPLAQQAAAATAEIEDGAAAEAVLDAQLQQLRRHIREAVRLAEEGAAAIFAHLGGEERGPAPPHQPDVHAASEGSLDPAETTSSQAPSSAALRGLPPAPEPSRDRVEPEQDQPEGPATGEGAGPRAS